MTFEAFFKSKWATVGLVLSLLMILVGTSRLFFQKYEVEREIKGLQDKANQIENENEELSELIKYLNTKEYTERAARDKLNLKKEGEIVVSIPQTQAEGEVAGSNQENESNFTKWYNYFFQ